MEEETKVGTSDEANDQIEVSDALAQYIGLFSYDCNQFKYYLAANSVVDWFGRTVRGPSKIHEYLRHEVSSQYEHINFNKATECEPIESSEEHMKTQIISVREVNYIHWTNRVAGITSLKPYAESDVEGDDVEMRPLNSEVMKTPEKTNSSIIEELTPPPSTTKHAAPAVVESDDEDDNVEVKAKRPKLMKPKLGVRRKLSGVMTFPEKRSRPNTKEAHISHGEDTSSDEDEDGTGDGDDTKKAIAYTPLHYLEAEGVLRTRVQPKNREYQSRSSPATGNECDTKVTNWDRAVRIRISYRKRIVDQQLEFALVIYEHLHGAPVNLPRRRNLILEFSEVANEETADNSDDDVNADDELSTSDEQPATVLNADEETVVATVETPTTAEIAAALETAAFAVSPLRTPTKSAHTPPGTPKRKPRSAKMSGLRRFNSSPSTSTPKGSRRAARCLRL